MLMDCSISLHLACVLGRVKLVEQLLAECPAIINAMSSVNKLTAVHVAAKHGREAVLDLLLARMSPDLVVATTSEDHRTPLHFAAQKGHVKIVEKLLAHSPGLIDVQDVDRKTALYLAIEGGHDLVVAQLMKFKPNFVLEKMVDEYDEFKKKQRVVETKSAVYVAVENSHEKIVAMLLANPESAALGEDKSGWTPLHMAANEAFHIIGMYGEPNPIVALLLAHCDPSLTGRRDCRGQTALHHAIQAGNTNIVKQLLAHSPATVHVVDLKMKSALHLAVEYGDQEVVELLLDANAAIDAVDKHKSSALHIAVEYGHTEFVELLLARKALVTDDRDGDKYDSIIFRPVACGNSQIVDMLLAHRPQLLDARSKLAGWNTLHFATDPEGVHQLSLDPDFFGYGRRRDFVINPEIVHQLLSLKPALLVETDRNGVSPLDTAIKNNEDELVAQMLALSDEQTLEVLLANRPELVHNVKLSSAGTLLHCVLNRRDDDDARLMMSQSVVNKVWKLNKQAVHVVNNLSKETPFHIALRRGLDWAIEMMQGQVSLDGIAEACKQTQTSQDRFRPDVNLNEQLSADVTEVVCEYLGFESATRKRVGKRARDD